MKPTGRPDEAANEHELLMIVKDELRVITVKDKLRVITVMIFEG